MESSTELVIEIEELVDTIPNDMELGKIVRKLINKSREYKKTT